VGGQKDAAKATAEAASVFNQINRII